ncbi:hypothetical protein E2562_013640 [Oryza meyeriana var. granulata]|uniref:Uncharacterized protein n=1 Tax=Oryza meyeriana var. granulata TaxID=110450 RepID=A0A6G1BKA6_9ORYZ|nr:hypothetical protein E2562_013640 [Oryza meyeriana var. granulata]
MAHQQHRGFNGGDMAPNRWRQDSSDCTLSTTAEQLTRATRPRLARAAYRRATGVHGLLLHWFTGKHRVGARVADRSNAGARLTKAYISCRSPPLRKGKKVREAMVD